MSVESSRDPHDLDEQALIDRIRLGDVAAFDAMYVRYHPRLLEFAFRYLHSREAAEDVVQETMLAIWNVRASWQITHGLAAYLYGAVRNRALQVARHDGIVAKAALSGMLAQLRGSPEWTNPVEGLLANEARHLVRAAIMKLSEGQKRVLLLRWQDELTSAQIGHALGISEAAARKQVQRAEAALRAMLEQLR